MTAIDLTAITAHLTDRRASMVTNGVALLTNAVTAGVVPNMMFNDVKDTFNRAIEEGADAFLATGPHKAGHHKSDWWLAAYDADAFVSNAHGLPAALKRTKQKPFGSYRGDLSAYGQFLALLMPLRELLDAAKPLIKKRGELPKVQTAKQIADDAARMTCQCCGRRILANLGSIAHHGYERPSHGWQTGSCIGAKEQPFEVSRDILGLMIDRWHTEHSTRKAQLAAIMTETDGFSVMVEDRAAKRDRYGEHPVLWVHVTRAQFASRKADHKAEFERRGYDSFDAVKATEITQRKAQIAAISAAIKEQTARYTMWKQTHKGFDRETGNWVAL